MTDPVPFNRLALFACLAGLVSIVCFSLFNLNSFWSDVIVGAPFFSLALGLMALVLGILAFGLDTAAGLLFAKGLNWISRGGLNPLIGAAGISAFPMAARVVQRVGQEEDFENFLLMHAMGANAAGQVASVVAGGVVLALMGAG